LIDGDRRLKTANVKVLLSSCAKEKKKRQRNWGYRAREWSGG